MSERTTTRVCVIGAGIAGLMAAALLAKKGLSVTVFEQESSIGGRASSFDGSTISLEEYKRLLTTHSMSLPFSEPDLSTLFEKRLLDGFTLDLGYHAIGGGDHSTLNDLLLELEDHADFLESKVGMVDENGVRFPFLSKLDKIRVLPNILRLVFADEKKMLALDTIPISDTIKRYGKGKMGAVLEVFSRSISTINDLSLISTGEMLRAQRNLYGGSKPVGYPIGGLGRVNNKLAGHIAALGGQVIVDSQVQKIVIENKKVAGVIVNDEFHAFDVVVSSVLVQHLFSILDKKHLPENYVSYLSSLNATASLCAYYALDELDADLIGKTFHFLERDVGVVGTDVVGMIDFMSASPDADLSPEKMFLVQAYVICTPEETRDEKMLLKLRNILDRNLERLVPDYTSSLSWALYPLVWHLDGVAKTIDNEKPEITTPLENLFIIGDCVKAPGIGYNCAINSAKILLECIK